MNGTNERSASAPRPDTILFALSALTGVMSAAASGAGLYLGGADSIPQLAAAAIPGVFAFLLSWLMAQSVVRSGDPLLPEGEWDTLLPLLAADAPKLLPAAATCPADTQEHTLHG
jgi:hypothetical protein